MATNMILSQASMVKAHALALQVSRWNTGRSKVNGRTFYVVPASDGVTAHWTAQDGRGCTCKGHRRNGHCTHCEAVQIHNQREQATRRPTYDELFPMNEDAL